MNGKDLFTELGNISLKYYDTAENGTIVSTHKKFKRPFLAAALIAMMLLLTGCAVAYVLHMQDMKVGEQEVTSPVYNEYMEFQGNETISQHVLSLAGVKGTPSFQAAQEWFAFEQNYDTDHEILDAVWGNEAEFPEQYAAYNVYSQEMMDKLDEIAAKHNLKLQGSRVKLHGGRRFYEEMDIDDILMPDSGASASIESAYGYENGSWGLWLFFMSMPEEDGQWPYRMTNSLYYNKKDCLSTDLVALDKTEDWVEWNYTTASGQDVLLLMSRSDYAGWIICDRADAMISVRVEVRNDVGYNEEGKQWFDSTYMSDKQFEKVADAINFAMMPEYQGEAVSTVDKTNLTQTQNGCTITVKSLETDGHVAYITLGVTAPESEALEQAIQNGKNISIGNWGSGFLTPQTEGENGGSRGCRTYDDGDGLYNTFDLVIDVQCSWEDGAAPFQASPVWNLYIEDLLYSTWNGEKCQFDDTVVAGGTWNFELTFDTSDIQEIELTPEPITTKACIGWKPNGTNVYEDVEISSFTLRSLSATIVDNSNSADYTDGQQVFIVMKDSSQVELLGCNGEIYLTASPVDVSQVDHVLLGDGTKLPTP